MRLDDLDPGTLASLLGRPVGTVEVVETHEETNFHARLRVDGEAMFCKLPPTDPQRRAAILATGMGEREARFYTSLAGSLGLRTPTSYGGWFDDTGEFVVLVEDIVESGCTVSDGTVGVRPDAAAFALEELAAVHVRFEDPARRAAEAPWVAPAGPGSDYAVDMLRHGIEHHREKLGKPFVAVAERYCRDRHSLQALWHAGPHTVVHADPHVGNVFDDHGRTGFLDWGLIMLSTPMRDVSYFLTMAMDIDDRRAHERELLRTYVDARRALGGAPLPFDDAWRQHRLQASYTVAASCQAVLFPEGATEARRTFADAFLERSKAAVEDLEALAAVEELS